MSSVAVPWRKVWIWTRRTLIVLFLAVAAFFGGMATTQIWPVHTETQFFAAEVSVQPSFSSTVSMPMVVGDVIVTFDGPLPAPGLTAQVAVREEITDLLRSGRLQTSDLQPDQAELRTAIDEGVQEVGWKFAAGALVTSTLMLLAYMILRPKRAGRALIAAGVASTLALAVPGVAAYLTYRTDKVTEFRATSLLSVVQANTDLFAGLGRKADQGAIYITNLLALSDAVRQEFTPGSTEQPVAAKFLLVSDIHGMNQYPLMAQIIQNQDIDAVIDTGDLVNFGRPQEGELTGIFEGIESLGVPYLFVRGNHDGAHQSDQAVLDRMAEVPGVILLEPRDGELVRAEVHGVSVSGFNDRRFYAQAGVDFAQQQADLAAWFREASADTEPTDIVATHQPYAANRVSATGVTVAGHMHSQALTNNHIQLGSFTGGGLVNQFRLPPLTEEAQEAAEEDPETAGELMGHPYSFDILTIGTDCSVLSLTRYSYRNLVSGEPQFDDVSLINGRTLQPNPPAGRSCGPELGVTTRPLVSDSPEGGAATTPAIPAVDATGATKIPAFPILPDQEGEG